jgi:uncharacterized membrane protein (UPF0127 family)
MRLHRALIWITGAWLLAGTAARTTAAEPTTLRLPNGRLVTLELAATPQQRSIGLMLRPSLDENHGMLFLFPQPDRYGIWMKNMLIPIDILWLDDHKRIIHVESNVPPCRIEPCLIYQPPTAALYVIELAAGAAVQAGLQPGLTLQLSTPDDQSPPPPPSSGKR